MDRNDEFEAAWGEITDIIAQMVNASIADDDITVESLRMEVLDKLKDIDCEFDGNASVLATIAQYLALPNEKLDLFLKAYRIAERTQDLLNLTLISHSIAEIYVCDFKDVENGDAWLSKLNNSPILNMTNRNT